jgi:hypothetical protein
MFWPASSTRVAEHEEAAVVEVCADADVDEHGLPTRDLIRTIANE